MSPTGAEVVRKRLSKPWSCLLVWGSVAAIDVLSIGYLFDGHAFLGGEVLLSLMCCQLFFILFLTVK